MHSSVKHALCCGTPVCVLCNYAYTLGGWKIRVKNPVVMATDVRSYYRFISMGTLLNLSMVYIFYNSSA